MYIVGYLKKFNQISEMALKLELPEKAIQTLERTKGEALSNLTRSSWEGRVADKKNVEVHFDEFLKRGDAGIIVITRELAEEIAEKIYNVNSNSVIPVIIEIPGIDDPRGFSASILGYITEALGISI